jgi:hypothetical protein
MFGRYQNVFRSRWKALWWAAGVLMTAYCTVPSPDEPVAAPAASPAPSVAKAPASEPDNSWMLGGAAQPSGASAPSHS